MNRPSGFARLHLRLGLAPDLLQRPLLQHVDLVDAAENRIVAVDNLLGLSQVGVAQRWGRKRLDGPDAQSLVGVDQCHDLAAVVVDGWRAALLDEFDVAPLEGQYEFIVDPPAQESARHITADAMNINPGLVDGAGIIETAVQAKVHQAFIIAIVGQEQTVKDFVIDEQRGAVERSVRATRRR